MPNRARSIPLTSPQSSRSHAERRTVGPRPRRRATALLGGAATLAFTCSAFAGLAEPLFFKRVSAFEVFRNTSVENETVAEIVTSTSDGMKLVYTDAASGRIGFVDIADPSMPLPAGTIETAGEPTSVSSLGQLILAAVNTSRSFVTPSGHLLVIDGATQAVLRQIDLGGQPDSIAISKDGRFAAVVIENERDEELGDGKPPQLPGGFLVIVDLVGEPSRWTTREVDLTGIATLFPADPEPEFVDINESNIAVITLQENNHIALVDLVSGTVTGHYEAGTVDLEQVDVMNNSLIELAGAVDAVAREPDAVVWVSERAFATANEGDLFGGSRGFTLFGDDGEILYDAGNTYEWTAVRHGHYPESRSGSKGTEPEGAAYSVYDSPTGPERLLFVASERGSFIGVYRLPGACTGDIDGDGGVDGADLGILLAAWGPNASTPADLDGNGAVDVDDLVALVDAWGFCDVTPELVQVLPAGARPEGLLAIPQRGLFVASSELDDRAGKVRSTITIYERGSERTYPSFISADRADGSPIPWGALSGFIADPTDGDRMFGVHDSVYRKTRVFTFDLSTAPATITAELPLRDDAGVLLAALEKIKALLAETPSFVPANFVNADGTVNIDGEGLALAAGRGFWIAHEGAGNLVEGVSNPASQPFVSPNLLVRVDDRGVIAEVVALPIDLTSNQLRFGFEGVASVEEAGNEVLYVAFQREWLAAGDLAGFARIGRYETATGLWSFSAYPLDEATSPNGGWVGLSEITLVGPNRFAIIERDDQALSDARIKRVYEFSIADVEFVQVGGGALPTLTKSLRRDLIADGDFDAGVVLEKIEGMAILADGRTLVISDNDGIGSTSGETRMIDLGPLFGE